MRWPLTQHCLYVTKTPVALQCWAEIYSISKLPYGISVRKFRLRQVREAAVRLPSSVLCSPQHQSSQWWSGHSLIRLWFWFQKVCFSLPHPSTSPSPPVLSLLPLSFLPPSHSCSHSFLLSSVTLWRPEYFLLHRHQLVSHSYYSFSSLRTLYRLHRVKAQVLLQFFCYLFFLFSFVCFWYPMPGLIATWKLLDLSAR